MSVSHLTPNPQIEKEGATRVSGLALRLFWMFLGNAALGMSAIVILNGTGGALSAADAVYAVFVPLLIGVRYVDITRYNGVTAYGQPATIAHWKRYAAVLVVGSAGVWGACHAAAYLLGQ